MQYLPGDLAQIQSDEEKQRERQRRAQQLMQAGFNPAPNANPILAILGSVLSTVKGNAEFKDAEGKLSENLRKRFDAENQAAQAKAAQEAQRRRDDQDFDLKKIDYSADAAARNRPPKEPSFEEKLFAMLPEGMRGQAALGKFGLGPKAGPAAPEFQRKIDALIATGMSPAEATRLVIGGGTNIPSGYEPNPEGGVRPIKGGPADPATKGAAGGGLAAEASSKVALYENAMRDAEAYHKAVVNPDGSFNDIAANMPENVRLRESALRAKLRAESGASISPEEARAENDRYGAKLFSSDATNAAAAGRLIDDLRHQVTTVRSGGRDAGGSSTAKGPPFEQWIVAARASNPDASDQELKAFFANKYGAK